MKLDAAVKLKPKLNSKRWPWDYWLVFLTRFLCSPTHLVQALHKLYLETLLAAPLTRLFADALSFRYLLIHHRKPQPASGCRPKQHNLLLLSCFWRVHLQTHFIAKWQYQTIDCKPTICKDLQNCYGKFADTSIKLIAYHHQNDDKTDKTNKTKVISFACQK